jgi:integrase
MSSRISRWPRPKHGPRSRGTLDAPSGAPRTPVRISWSLNDLDRRFDGFVGYATDVLCHSADTLASYRVAYKNFRSFLADRVPDGEAPLGDALFDIRGWLGWNRTRSGVLTDASKNTYFRRLRRFFDDMAEHDGVPNPFDALPTPPMGKRLPKARTAAECMRVIDAAANYAYWEHPYDRARAVAMIGVILFAGLRRGEVLRLKFTDVRIEEGKLLIFGGKGIGDGKDRVVWMSADLRRILQAYLSERHRARISAPEFFSTRQDNGPVSLSTFRRIASRVRKASGVPFSLHSLRHSYITQLLRCGVAIHVAAELAGHSKITTTAGYLATDDADKRTAAQRLSYR